MKKIRAKHIKDVQGCEKFQGFISCADPRERIFEIEKSKSLHFPLRQLNLRYCNSVTSQGLKDIVRNCPFISQLSLEGSVSLSVDVLPEVIEKLHDLRKLNISDREDILPSRIWTSISYCHPNIESIVIDKIECDGHMELMKGLVLRWRKLTKLRFF